MNSVTDGSIFASLDARRRGEDRKIVEINGYGGETIDAWDPVLSIAKAYRRIFDQQRIIFMIGDQNRGRGVEPTLTAEFIGRFIARRRPFIAIPNLASAVTNDGWHGRPAASS